MTHGCRARNHMVLGAFDRVPIGPIFEMVFKGIALDMARRPWFVRANGELNGGVLFGDGQIGFEGAAYRPSDENQIGGVNAPVKIEVGEYGVTRHGNRNGIDVDLIHFSIPVGIPKESVEVKVGFKNPIGIEIQLKSVVSIAHGAVSAIRDPVGSEIDRECGST
jgi:hypothetical protein